MKKTQMQEGVLEQMKATYNSAAKPENKGPSSSGIREIQATVPKGTRFQDMSLKTPLVERQSLEGAQDAQKKAVSEYENAAEVPEIQGVYFVQQRGF